MPNEVLVALIGGVAVAIPSVLTTIYSNNTARKITDYKIEELTKKVEKHNNVVERMSLVERDMKTVWRNIDEIKDSLKEVEKERGE